MEHTHKLLLPCSQQISNFRFWSYFRKKICETFWIFSKWFTYHSNFGYGKLKTIFEYHCEELTHYRHCKSMRKSSEMLKQNLVCFYCSHVSQKNINLKRETKKKKQKIISIDILSIYKFGKFVWIIWNSMNLISFPTWMTWFMNGSPKRRQLLMEFHANVPDCLNVIGLIFQWKSN